MSQLKIVSAPKVFDLEVALPRSKSISNRLLIVQALSSSKPIISGLSEAEDTQDLIHALSDSNETINAGNGGSTSRFLLALACVQNQRRTIDVGSQMKKRPIKPLVDALIQLGFDISYLQKTGRFPIHIEPVDLGSIKNNVSIDSGVSSQFVSALMLIGPALPSGLIVEMKGSAVSSSYIDLTQKIMSTAGAKIERTPNSIHITPTGYSLTQSFVEADWSAASYWYEIAALSDTCNIYLPELTADSLQGDVALVDLFYPFGVKTSFTSTGAKIEKSPSHSPRNLAPQNFINFPDIAQTYLATCAGLKLSTHISGIQTLHIKETNRVSALNGELRKIGTAIELLNVNELNILHNEGLPGDLKFEPYGDHRMAMCLAPLAIKHAPIWISDPNVVTKSYPSFWRDLEKAGFNIET